LTTTRTKKLRNKRRKTIIKKSNIYDDVYLGSSKGFPGNPNSLSNITVHYWRCGFCGSIIWSTDINKPECICGRRQKEIERQNKWYRRLKQWMLQQQIYLRF
jgi:hypothetical protein